MGIGYNRFVEQFVYECDCVLTNYNKTELADTPILGQFTEYAVF